MPVNRSAWRASTAGSPLFFLGDGVSALNQNTIYTCPVIRINMYEHRHSMYI